MRSCLLSRVWFWISCNYDIKLARIFIFHKIEYIGCICFYLEFRINSNLSSILIGANGESMAPTKYLIHLMEDRL